MCPEQQRNPRIRERAKVVTTQRIETQFAGRPFTLETGRLAKQAAGSALLRFGDTMVLAAVTVSPNISTLPFFPLTVEYREKTYAAGKIPGGFLKREGRPSDDEILAARLIDRSIRPLFPEGFKNEVQVFVTVLSADQENDADVLGRGRGLGRAEPVDRALERAAGRGARGRGSRATGSSIRPSSSSSSPPSTWSSAARPTRSSWSRAARSRSRRPRCSRRSRWRRRGSRS